LRAGKAAQEKRTAQAAVRAVVGEGIGSLASFRAPELCAATPDALPVDRWYRRVRTFGPPWNEGRLKRANRGLLRRRCSARQRVVLRSVDLADWSPGELREGEHEACFVGGAARLDGEGAGRDGVAPRPDRERLLPLRLLERADRAFREEQRERGGHERQHEQAGGEHWTPPFAVGGDRVVARNPGGWSLVKWRRPV
jgi:hypothetical protein